jgi:hypothetical protein
LNAGFEVAPSEVWSVYNDELAMISHSYDTLRTSTSEPPARFLGWSPADVGDAFHRVRTELDHQANLRLAASFEALLQLDCRDRVGGRPKGTDWRRFRDLQRRAEGRNQRVLTEDILGLWGQVTGRTRLFGRAKQFIQHRHWLAHGRYWLCKCGNHSIAPPVAWNLIRTTHAAMIAHADVREL